MRLHPALFTTLMVICTSSCADPAPTRDFNIARSSVMHHEFDQRLGHTYILNDSSVFVARKGPDTTLIITATQFYNGSVEKDALVKRMLWILEATNASTEFQDWAKNNLARNRRFRQDSFVMPLTSSNMEIHEFSFSSTGHNKLYILAYRRLKPSM